MNNHFTHSHAIIFIGNSTSLLKTKVDEIVAQRLIHSLDVFTISESAVSISHIRQLTTFFYQKPLASKSRVAIINGDGLSLPAQNALLKILEEPPAARTIFIITTNLHLLLPTIHSRCTIKYIGQLIPESGHEKDEILFWNELLQKNIGERLIMSDRIAKNRDEVIIWLDKQQLLLRSELYQMPKKRKQYAQCLQAIITAKTRLKQNCSVKLTLDHMFMELPVYRFQ